MKMPVLNPQFFHDHAPNLEFFQKWKNTSHWGPTILPLYEWQGILFIGVCSGIKMELANIQHVFVLADSISLHTLWAQWQETTPETNLDVPDGLNEELLSIPSSEAPEGLSLDASIQQAPTKPQELPEELIESLDLNIKPELVTMAPESELSDETPCPVPLRSSAIRSPLPPPLPASVLSNVKKTSGLEKKSSGQDIEVEDIFAKLNAHFRECMIFLVTGQVAKPWKWTDGFTTPSKVQSLDIRQPSPLRVIFRTHKSFYGSVKQSPIVDQFAKNWLQGKVPTDLAVTPILNEDQLVGIILCNGNAKPESLEPLNILEKATAEVTARFSANPNLFHAA